MKRIDRLETEMAQVEKELACAQLTITRLDDRIENICQTVVDLDKKFSKLEHFVLKQNEPQCLCKCPMNGIMNLWQELNKLIGKVSAMGQDITGEREDVGGLKKRVDIVEKLYAGLSHEIQQNYEELEAEIDETDRLHSLLADDTDTRLKALESQTSQIFVICSICNGRGSFENKKEMDYENIINGVKFPVGTEYIQLIRCIVCKGKGKNPLKPKEQ